MQEVTPQWIVRELVLDNPRGLHARPASLVVQAARSYVSDIVLVCGDKEANCKSLMALLTLCATDGTLLQIRASGDDAPDAIEAVQKALCEQSVSSPS